MKTKKTLLILIAILLISFVTLFLLPQSILAVTGFSVPFGGRILITVECTCTGTTLLTVGPPRGGQYMLTLASRIYAKYSPFPGHWVLGLAEGLPLICWVGTPPYCLPAGEGPGIKIMGTS